VERAYAYTNISDSYAGGSVSFWLRSHKPHRPEGKFQIESSPCSSKLGIWIGLNDPTLINLPVKKPWRKPNSLLLSFEFDTNIETTKGYV
jgi:hypothetical protein